MSVGINNLKISKFQNISEQNWTFNTINEYITYKWIGYCSINSTYSFSTRSNFSGGGGLYVKEVGKKTILPLQGTTGLIGDYIIIQSSLKSGVSIFVNNPVLVHNNFSYLINF